MKRETIDRKFRILAVNPCNGKIYTEKDALLLCAKDKAVLRALWAYHDECVNLKCGDEHIASIKLLIARVRRFQEEVEAKTPDTEGACEIARCIHGEGTE
jgi:hypothetical protein